MRNTPTLNKPLVLFSAMGVIAVLLLAPWPAHVRASGPPTDQGITLSLDLTSQNITCDGTSVTEVAVLNPVPCGVRAALEAGASITNLQYSVSKVQYNGTDVTSTYASHVTFAPQTIGPAAIDDGCCGLQTTMTFSNFPYLIGTWTVTVNAVLNYTDSHGNLQTASATKDVTNVLTQVQIVPAVPLIGATAHTSGSLDRYGNRGTLPNIPLNAYLAKALDGNDAAGQVMIALYFEQAPTKGSYKFNITESNTISAHTTPLASVGGAGSITVNVSASQQGHSLYSNSGSGSTGTLPIIGAIQSVSGGDFANLLSQVGSNTTNTGGTQLLVYTLSYAWGDRGGPNQTTSALLNPSNDTFNWKQFAGDQIFGSPPSFSNAQVIGYEHATDLIGLTTISNIPNGTGGQGSATDYAAVKFFDSGGTSMAAFTNSSGVDNVQLYSKTSSDSDYLNKSLSNGYLNSFNGDVYEQIQVVYGQIIINSDEPGLSRVWASPPTFTDPFDGGTFNRIENDGGQWDASVNSVWAQYVSGDNILDNHDTRNGYSLQFAGQPIETDFSHSTASLVVTASPAEAFTSSASGMPSLDFPINYDVYAMSHSDRTNELYAIGQMFSFTKGPVSFNLSCLATDQDAAQVHSRVLVNAAFFLLEGQQYVNNTTGDITAYGSAQSHTLEGSSGAPYEDKVIAASWGFYPDFHQTRETKTPHLFAMPNPLIFVVGGDGIAVGRGAVAGTDKTPNGDRIGYAKFYLSPIGIVPADSIANTIGNPQIYTSSHPFAIWNIGQ